mgnify:CR=1 FL=1
MPVEYIALAVSIFSVLVASLSLGWNIYRDIILKAKVDVSFGVVSVIHVSLPETPHYLNLRITNFGPGPVTISTIIVKEVQLWRRLLRKTRNAFITPDYTNPLSAKLPAKIEVGDKIELLLPYDEDCFLKSRFTQVGVYDYFGRYHRAPKSDLKKAYSQWEKDFSKKTS